MSNLDNDDDTTAIGGDEGHAPVVTEGTGSEPGPFTRGISDRTRELFKAAAAKVKAQLESGDEDDAPAIGMEASEAAPAEPAKAAEPAAEKVPEAEPQTASPAAAVADAEVIAARAQLDAERAALAAERAELERLRTTASAEEMPDDPAAFIREQVKRWTGADDAGLKQEIADLVTELSAHVLGVPLAPAAQAELSRKRAERLVRGHSARLDKRERDLAEKDRARQEAADKAEAHRALSSAFAAKAAEFPFLAAEDDPAAVVFAIMEADHKRTGVIPQWSDAAKRAEAAIKAKATSWHAKRARLFQSETPAAEAAPKDNATKSSATSTGAALTNRGAAVAATTPPPLDDDLPIEERRARSMRRLRASLAEREAG